MAGLIDEKLKKMQDEMSRFEEEIGLPLPAVPLPPNKPRVIAANTFHEAEIKLANIPVDLPPAPPPPLPNGMPTVLPGQPFPRLPPPPPPLQSMFGGPPPMPPNLCPPMPPGGLPSLPPPMPPLMQGPGMPGPPLGGPPMGGPPMPPGSLPPGPPLLCPPMNHGQPPVPGPPMPPNAMFPPGVLTPPVTGGYPTMMPPPEQLPQVEKAPAPVVLSATPMLYVANPQLEIAAIQAEQLMRPAETPVEKKKQLPKIEKPTVTVVTEPVVSKKKEKKNRKLIRTAGGQTWEDPNLAEWEDDDFRLFCGDLGNDVTDEVLSRAFSKYTSFSKAKVIRDKRTNKTKGFGFVSFKDPQDFIKATKEMNGRYVGSRPIKIRKSTWKNRCLDVVRKKEKEKQALINRLTGK